MKFENEEKGTSQCHEEWRELQPDIRGAEWMYCEDKGFLSTLPPYLVESLLPQLARAKGIAEHTKLGNWSLSNDRILESATDNSESDFFVQYSKKESGVRQQLPIS